LWYTKEESDQCISMTAKRIATGAGFSAGLMVRFRLSRDWLGELELELEVELGEDCVEQSFKEHGPIWFAVC
jgi:hypothetical protein